MVGVLQISDFLLKFQTSVNLSGTVASIHTQGEESTAMLAAL